MSGPDAAAAQAARPLVLGSWPGAEVTHNRFLPILLDALQSLGVQIRSFPESRDIDVAGLDALLIHWPDKVFWEATSSPEALGRMLRFLQVLRRRPAKTRLIWMVHDLAPHDLRRVRRLTWPPYRRALVRLIDGAVTLSRGTVDVVRDGLQPAHDVPVGHIWHPYYPDETVAAEAIHRRRAAFGWEAGERVFGYCGQIRPYKGVEDLVAAFRRFDAPEARLLIAGRPRNAAIAGDLTGQASGDPRIRLHLEDLSATEFREFLSACDIVVAPFRHYLHSGSLIHTLSCQRPILTPSTPFAESIADRIVSPGWIQTYRGPLTPDHLGGISPPDGAPDLGRLSPEQAGKDLLDFVNALMPSR